jgi:predicted DNA-binding protein (MmcQ/YjbR family)
MNKKYWNTVLLDGSVPGVLVRQLIDHSYELIQATAQKSKATKKPIAKRRK